MIDIKLNGKNVFIGDYVKYYKGRIMVRGFYIGEKVKCSIMIPIM